MVSNVENGPSAKALFTAALKRHETGDSRTALRILFDLFRVHPFHEEGLKAAAKLSETLGSRQEAELFSAVADRPEDPQALYDLGYAFVESGLPEIAAAYLEACADRRPEDHLVRYELAFARFRSGRYASATELLKPLAADPNLPGAESFASRLLLVESLVHQGEIDHARRIFDLLEPAGASAHAESQLDALSGLLARAALFPSTADLARRDWHFIEHAGVLLLEARARESALPTGTLGPESLAAILLRLAALLRSLDLEPREIQHLTPRTRPLAVALARMMGASCSTFQQNTEHRTLVVLHEPGEAEPFLCDLRNHEEGVHLFALYADPRRRYALHPEIVGLFGGELELPWTAPAEAAAQSVVAALPALDQDAAELDSLCRYYAPLRELLVLGHPDRHPVRRVLTPLRRHPGPDAP